MRAASVLTLLSCMLGVVAAFRPAAGFRAAVVRSYSRSTAVQMNLFNKIFGPKKSATASHILVKDQAFLTKLKGELENSKNVPQAFSDAALKYSTCPSSKRGGSLGTFKQGQMVPAFDKVVFETGEVGKIAGPVTTPFGYHLILIDERSA